MTAPWNRAESGRLIAAARKRYAATGLVGTADALDVADQLEAALARIADLEAESLKWYQSAADGIDGALEHGVRESDRRDARIAELEKLVDELRCGDLGHFESGELSDERHAAFQIHLGTCKECQSDLHGLMQLDVIATRHHE